MQIAIATHQPLSELMEAEDELLATWIDVLDEQAEQAKRR